MKKTSKEKLYEAAVELITAQGYDNTTVQQIADKAGLTERTFFRQFKDKADILFGGGEEYTEMLLNEMRTSQQTNSVLVVMDGYFFAADYFDSYAERTKRRAAIVASHPDLQERELLKQVHVEEVLTSALAERCDGATARLSVRVARAIFSVAQEEWLGGSRKKLRSLLQISLKNYQDLTSQP